MKQVLITALVVLSVMIHVGVANAAVIDVDGVQCGGTPPNEICTQSYVCTVGVCIVVWNT